MSFASVGVMDIYSYITDCVALIPLFTLLQYFFFLQHPDITLLQLAFSEKHLPATISVDVIICCTLSSKLHFDVLRRLIVLGVLTQHSLYVSF